MFKSRCDRRYVPYFACLTVGGKDCLNSMSDLVNIRAAVGHDFAVLQHPLKLLSVMLRYCFERAVFPNVCTRPVAGVVGALDVTQEMQNISTHDEASFQKPAFEKDRRCLNARKKLK